MPRTFHLTSPSRCMTLNRMVKCSAAALDATFHALADSTRRAILSRLAKGQSSVTTLAAQFDISLPGVMKHLRALESAGLLASDKKGRVRRCRLVPGPMKNAAQWIEFYRAFWEDQFDALEDFLAETAEEEEPWKQEHPQRKAPSASNAPSPRPGKKSSRRGPTRK